MNRGRYTLWSSRNSAADGRNSAVVHVATKRSLLLIQVATRKSHNLKPVATVTTLSLKIKVIRRNRYIGIPGDFKETGRNVVTVATKC